MRNQTKRLLREFDNKVVAKQLRKIGKDFMKSLNKKAGER